MKVLTTISSKTGNENNGIKETIKRDNTTIDNKLLSTVNRILQYMDKNGLQRVDFNFDKKTKN